MESRIRKLEDALNELKIHFRWAIGIAVVCAAASSAYLGHEWYTFPFRIDKLLKERQSNLVSELVERLKPETENKVREIIPNMIREEVLRTLPAQIKTELPNQLPSHIERMLPKALRSAQDKQVLLRELINKEFMGVEVSFEDGIRVLVDGGDFLNTDIADLFAQCISSILKKNPDIYVESLNLSTTGLSDKGLLYFMGLPNFSQIYVIGTKVTENGINEFRQSFKREITILHRFK